MSIGDFIRILSPLLVLMYCVHKCSGLLCYNCSSTHRTESQCGGAFGKTPQEFNSSRFYLVNCSGDSAMCFVRSWSARAKHAWIVQRGCYQVSSTDTLPKAMDTPTRAMTCRLERLADAEYKVCLCQADWCNMTSQSRDYSILNLKVLKSIIYLYAIFVIS